MRGIRLRVGGPGDPGPDGGRWRRRGLLALLLGLGLPLVILAGVGVGVYQMFFRVPEFRALLFDGGRVARGAVLPLPDGAVVLSQENAQPALEAIRAGRRQAGEARVYLTRIVAAASDKPRWDVALDGVPGPETGQARLTRDDTRALLAFRDRLEARALDTGAALWTATLTDAIHPACRQCLAAGGGRVVALAADGAVQAFDAQTGRPLWKSPTRLNRPVLPDLEVAADLVSVVDRGESPSEAEILLLRADSGQVARRIRPACAPRGASPDATQVERGGDRLVLAVGRSHFAYCVEAWDLRRGALLWQASLPRPGVRIEGDRVPWYVTTGSGLYVGQATVGADGRSAVWAIALDTGRVRPLALPNGYETRVLDARDGVVLLRATRQRGTVRDELWAVDAERGTLLWEKPLGATGGAPPRWTARIAPSGVALLQALDRPNRLAYEALDLRTGRSLRSATGEVEAATWDGVAWTDEAAWLTIASPYRVDLRAGALARPWPWQSLSNCQNIGGKIVCTR